MRSPASLAMARSRLLSASAARSRSLSSAWVLMDSATWRTSAEPVTGARTV